MVECIFLETPPLDVYGQMAIDELLVPAEPEDSFCMARFFNWIETPSATFGYAQFETSVKEQLSAAGIQEYTRRPTGGGVVIHKDDLTFSLFFKQTGGGVRPAEIYSNLHRAIKEEFVKNNLALGTYDKESDYRPTVAGVSSNCFNNPVSDDLLDSEGNKVLGGAIRRFGNCILYQGSLQFKAARYNKDYKETLKAAFLKYFNASARGEAAPPTLIEAARSLAVSQYKTKSWIEKF